MLAESSTVRVVADCADGTRRFREYGGRALERMAREIYSSDGISSDEGWPPFCAGFAAAVDVFASGLLSEAYPLGAAIRAYVDVNDPEKMPGRITDLAVYGRELR